LKEIVKSITNLVDVFTYEAFPFSRNIADIAMSSFFNWEVMCGHSKFSNIFTGFKVVDYN